MHPEPYAFVEEASALFRRHGLALSDKAKQSMGLALGLCRTPENLDDSHLAVGLLRTNSLLALLADKYQLDFSWDQEEIAQELEASSEAEFMEELRRQGAPVPTSQDDDPFGIFLPEETVVTGEGEPDSFCMEAFSNSYSYSNAVLDLACHHARNQGHDVVESFDLIYASSQSPLTLAVLESAGLTESQLLAEVNRYRLLEPCADSQQIILRVGERGHIHVSTFSLLDGYSYQERHFAAKAITVQLAAPTPFLTPAILSEFEDLINSRSVSEHEIHVFLVKHPELLLGDEYRTLHSKLILERPEGKLIPDFFAEAVTTGYTDIIDLKKPNEELIVGPRDRRGFSSSVIRAISQVRTYASYFDDVRRRARFEAVYGIHIFKPKVAVIIGRSRSVDPEDLIRQRRTLCGAEVITFDDLISRAQRRLITVQP